MRMWVCGAQFAQRVYTTALECPTACIETSVEGYWMSVALILNLAS
jgi:hypothetical protein